MISRSKVIKRSLKGFWFLPLIIFLLAPNTSEAQRYAGRLTLEFSIFYGNNWVNYTSRDGMVKVDYKEGRFEFDVRLESFSDGTLESDNSILYNYLKVDEFDVIRYIGLFTSEMNVPLERPIQNTKGDLYWDNNDYPMEIDFQTTLIKNDNSRIQFKVNKQFLFSDGIQDKQARILITGLINRTD